MKRLTDNGREVIKSGEVARMFRVVPYSVARWVRKGQLTPAYTVRGRYYFYRDEIEAQVRRSTS